MGLPVPAVGPTPGADGGTAGGVDLYKAGFSNSGSREFKVTVRLPHSLSPRKTTKYTLQTGVLGTVSKKPASSMFQSSILSDPWASFSDHSVFFSRSMTSWSRMK